MKHLFPLILAASLCLSAAPIASEAPAKGAIHTIGVDDFAQLIQQSHICLLDVRTAKEYADDHIPNATLIDISQPDFLPKTTHLPDTIAIYCRSGKRSLKAAQLLAPRGHTLYNLEGGILAWQKAGKPTVK
ncbi:MAG: rhodanese-like domain-containing protein [Bacteroidales bacterium]|nr:rhodanese-like domain-containing protein [Bacteroidales bacterium]